MEKGRTKSWKRSVKVTVIFQYKKVCPKDKHETSKVNVSSVEKSNVSKYIYGKVPKCLEEKRNRIINQLSRKRRSDVSISLTEIEKINRLYELYA